MTNPNQLLRELVSGRIAQGTDTPIYAITSEDLAKSLTVTKVKRADSNRTQASRTLTIERKAIRANIQRNGGRF